MGELYRRLRYLLQRNRHSQELADEMDFHREMAARAGRPASLSFGNAVRLREQSREAWGWTWIDRLIQDLSYAGRTLLRSPGFTMTAILVLAVGIGVNITAFSLFNMMVFQYLPVRDPASLVRLQRRSPDASTNTISYSAMLFYRDHARTLSAVMGTFGTSVLQLESDPQPVSSNFATENYFTELGIQPSLGRLLDPAQDRVNGSAPAVVISYGFWQRHYGADPNIVGKVIHLNQKPATIIGVTPYILPSLGNQHPDLWLPMNQIAYFIEGNTTLIDTGSSGPIEMWGRLAPGVSAKTAEQELLSLTNQLRKVHPKDIWDNEYIRTDPGGHDQIMQPEMLATMAMCGALVLLILAVACANLGGLLLARGVAREHEISIRVAIGANRKRIFRQLFTESLLLSSLGSAAGLFLGYIVIRITMAHANAPLWMTATPDWRVIAFAVAVGLFAALLFGFAPALQIARQRQRKTIARQMLLGAQVAASCVLLIVSGLLVRAVQHALHTNPGFGYEQVISIDPGLSTHGYKPADARNYIEQLSNRLRTIPGVTSVSLTSMTPLSHFRVSTISNTINGHLVRIFPFQVDPEFFSTMEIPLLRGRNFTPREEHAVIISDTLARKQWPGEDPIGKQDASGSAPGDVVVGVVANARLMDIQNGDTVELYHAAQEANMADLVILIKTAGVPEGFIPSVRTITRSLDPKLFPEVNTLKEGFRDTTRSSGNIAMVVSLLGFVAVFLAALGILGLVAYTVSQRTKDIAIRIALGAKPLHVLASLLSQFSWPVALGLVVGIGITAGVSHTMRGVLYGVSNLDPFSYIASIGILLAIIACAAFLPARRALRLDVARALHQD
ncbi:ABC transporter permease [Acidicapsa ligni]|uniref:ABC transporter permease n=1 Tax=Acidicapsa ligni TaxID=542300 RepID=UPI0021E03771|nr:ABC transporter permease [Acidicapsa ligni]